MRILILTLALLCGGCMQDDVSELKDMTGMNLNENNKAYYAAGVRDGLVLSGVPEDQAMIEADNVADEVFNGL